MRNNKNGRIKEPELKESVPRPRQITKSGKKKREKSEGGKNRKIRKRKRERERERAREKKHSRVCRVWHVSGETSADDWLFGTTHHNCFTIASLLVTPIRNEVTFSTTQRAPTGSNFSRETNENPLRNYGYTLIHTKNSKSGIHNAWTLRSCGKEPDRHVR